MTSSPIENKCLKQETKVTYKNKRTDVPVLVHDMVAQFSGQIDSFEDFVVITEIETSIIITEKDIMRLMLKGKLNEDTIRNAIPDENKDIADFICAIFDTKEWIGK